MTETIPRTHPDVVPAPEPDVFSLEGLAAWLRTQDPATEYYYPNVRDCLICRYGAAKLGTNNWGHIVKDGDGIPNLLLRADMDIASPTPWSHAAALARCEALIEQNTPGTSAARMPNTLAGATS